MDRGVQTIRYFWRKKAGTPSPVVYTNLVAERRDRDSAYPAEGS